MATGVRKVEEVDFEINVGDTVVKACSGIASL